MTLFLMRHGQTFWNLENRLQGSADIPLTDVGIKQAEDAAINLRNIPFDLILSSPLIRAKQTAECIACDRNIPIKVLSDLSEMNFGEFEGQVFGSTQKIRDVFARPECYYPNTGESYYQLIDRCKRFLEYVMLLDECYSNVLVVTHGAFLKGLFQVIKDTPLSEFWSGPPLKNCSVASVELVEEKFVILSEGEACSDYNLSTVDMI